MDNNIDEEIKSIIERKTNKVINKVNKIGDLGIDSMQFVECIVQIENHFGIEFPIEKMDLSLIDSFDELVDLVEKLYNVKKLENNNK
ncbi:MAG: acyl carrier protein [Lachnospiraceae bacterium]|nr:acyl carrier protein [Lachnospiraceae bacterium]